MKKYHLSRRQFIARPLSEVFPFFQKPENLARLTPLSLDFVILSPQPITMQEGATIDYTIRVMGLRVRWQTLISLYNPPHKFIDIQSKGPYKHWHHTHSFEEIDGGTMMYDEVEYAMPFGIVGSFAHFLNVQRQLEMIFDYRAQRIEEIFLGPEFKTRENYN